MAKPYKAKAVANFFLDCASAEKKKLDPMKLQKLLYVAHGWHLALDNEPLIDERVEAWRYGPVIPSLYHEFKGVGSGPIEGYATRFNIHKLEFEEPRIDDADPIVDFLERIWDVYGEFTAVQLSNMTHQPESPWGKTWSQNRGVRNLNISNDVIGEHYQEIARARREAQEDGEGSRS